ELLRPSEGREDPRQVEHRVDGVRNPRLERVHAHQLVDVRDAVLDPSGMEQSERGPGQSREQTLGVLGSTADRETSRRVLEGPREVAAGEPDPAPDVERVPGDVVNRPNA